MRIFALFVLILLIASACVQTKNKTVESKIDSLFHEWDNRTSPGAAVAVVKDGIVVFKKGYGMSNLEYDTPITPSSIFHIASESKQYVAYCIVLLAREGKLDLDDEVRKYLPYVPDFGKKVTIRHLIYHTSGLRDQWQLLAIGGQALEDVITQQHIIKLIEKQKELNFEPGSRMLYCNTGYTLLAEIVRKVSGKSLRTFTDERIFKPLGMTNTHFHDDNTEIVKNRTYSYDKTDSGKFINSPLNYATVGATSLFTTVEDEIKWLLNYETGTVGGMDAVNQMYQQCVLNNGRKIHYAFGIAVDSAKGYLRVGHGGADAGYRTYAVRFPEEHLGIVVFSNLGNFNPTELAMKVADLYLPERKDAVKPKSLHKIDSTLLPLFAGKYASDEEGPLDLLDSGRLYLKVNHQVYEMDPLSDSSFSLLNGRLKYTFESRPKASAKRFVVETPTEQVTFFRIGDIRLTDDQKSAYTGTYESDELETKYHIVLENGKLILRHRKYPDTTAKPITDTQFSTGHWWMSNLLFTHNKVGGIIGLEVNSDRVLHLKFRKVE
ncbi:MAG: beta-lactamase family protein [Bacteroidetes bacterium]|nr:beta-lactamase family protein [Bacteroidota bacterium]